MPIEVAMPRLSDSMEEGTIAAWLVEEGQPVRRGEPIVEIETDKATMAYEAEADGVLARIVVTAGGTAPLGATIAIVAVEGEALDAAERADAPTGSGIAASASRVSSNGTAPAPAAAAAAAGTAPASTRAKASPLARRVGRQLSVDLASVRGTGFGGRIVRADVEAFARAGGETPGAQAAPPPAPAPAVAPAPAPATPAADSGAKGATERVELSRLQQTVARRMAESRATVPTFEVAVDADMTACVELRERLRAIADPLPSYNDMVVKACAQALREHPRANGAYRDGAFELYERVNVGVAVAADDALVVPTVFDADRHSLGEIARETRRLAAAVRDGSITAPELGGGTFTVSNLGMLGVDRFSAVVNVPQAAILAVGALALRPAVSADGALVARQLMTLTLAADHRILYGADAARFLGRVRELLEQPLALAL